MLRVMITPLTDTDTEHMPSTLPFILENSPRPLESGQSGTVGHRIKINALRRPANEWILDHPYF